MVTASITIVLIVGWLIYKWIKSEDKFVWFLMMWLVGIISVICLFFFLIGMSVGENT